MGDFLRSLRLVALILVAGGTVGFVLGAFADLIVLQAVFGINADSTKLTKIIALSVVSIVSGLVGPYVFLGDTDSYEYNVVDSVLFLFGAFSVVLGTLVPHSMIW